MAKRKNKPTVQEPQVTPQADAAEQAPISGEQLGLDDSASIQPDTTQADQESAGENKQAGENHTATSGVPRSESTENANPEGVDSERPALVDSTSEDGTVAESPIDHPALAPNGNAIIYSDAEGTADATDEVVEHTKDESAEPSKDYFDFHLPGKERQAASDAFIAEEVAAASKTLDNEPDSFDHPAVLARISELNSGDIIQRGESVTVQLGSQVLFGTVAGHDVNKGQVSYHISVQISAADFITGQQAQELTLPIPAEFVSK